MELQILQRLIGIPTPNPRMSAFSIGYLKKQYVTCDTCKRRFQASVTVHMRLALFWEFTQRRIGGLLLTFRYNVSAPIFKGQTVKEICQKAGLSFEDRADRLPETSVTNYHFMLRTFVFQVAIQKFKD